MRTRGHRRAGARAANCLLLLLSLSLGLASPAQINTRQRQREKRVETDPPAIESLVREDCEQQLGPTLDKSEIRTHRVGEGDEDGDPYPEIRST